MIMQPTAEQQRYARIAGALILVHFVLEMGGDFVTILARGGETFAQTARYIVEHRTLWSAALLSVSLGWISVAVLGFALYVVVEPVHKRLAQLGLLLRLGGASVGAAMMMFRVAKERVSLAVDSTTFTAEQLSALAAIMQRATNAGVYISWIMVGLSSAILFHLFWRARYIPRFLAGLSIFAALLLVTVALVSFAAPQLASLLKPWLVTSLIAELVTAFWLLFKGIQSRSAT